MQVRSKIETFIGFSLRARKVVCGVNAVRAQRRGVCLLMLCGSASENTVKDALSLAKRFQAPLIRVKNGNLADLVLKENCKLAAFTDANLADAILKHCDDNFELVK